MLHPIFSTVVSRPDLVVDHLAGYTALLTQEVSTSGKDVLVRAVAWGFGALCALMFVGLAGTAVMLGVMMDKFNWVLVIVPAAALLLAVIAALSARRPSPAERFAELRSQIAADIGLLRAASGDAHGR